ncbi:hypothetical protein [Myroides guanonis]|uniref:Uncharacterized protein n=1 Tax=Myroides guanonis TaxID=1150112 RepID=A0A1I3PDM2_9FLAO|nr:hypothetical protein [Myroides guanonis]SFJ19106.1 hypothetical protein SAMN04487893_10463 [Myroides guanonis]
MKKKTLSLQTHLWTRSCYSSSYELISQMFDIAHLDYYKKEVLNYFHFAFQNEAYKEERVSEVIFNSYVLFSVFRACYNIYVRPNGFEKRNLLHEEVEERDYYLSSLSREEFINPYLAIKSIYDIVEIEELEGTFSEIVRATLLDSLEDVYTDERSVQIMTYFKLLDACWLINERMK